MRNLTYTRHKMLYNQFIAIRDSVHGKLMAYNVAQYQFSNACVDLCGDAYCKQK